MPSDPETRKNREGASFLPSQAMLASLCGKAGALSSSAGGRLLYLTLFGSTLYGTRIPGHSDLDVRGIYLPLVCPPETEAAFSSQKGLHDSTGAGDVRNSKDDIDIDLTPFDRWIMTDLPKGTMGALDLLFAPGNAVCTLFLDPVLAPVFEYPLRLLDLTDGRSCAEYALGQGRKYGLEGTLAGAQFRILGMVRSLPKDVRLRDWSACLACAGRAEEHCHVLPAGGLALGDAEHEGGITLGELARRLEKKLGSRMAAMERMRSTGEGVDWKALSHAVRAVRQHEDLLRTGRFHFPLPESFLGEIMAVKTGSLPFAAVEEKISSGLHDLERLRQTSSLAQRGNGNACARREVRARAAG